MEGSYFKYLEGCDLKYSDGYGIGKQSEGWDG